MNGPKQYEIRVQGHLGKGWSNWFEELTIHHTESGETILLGSVADQAALYGLLMRIRDLGLTLLSVSAEGSNQVHRTGGQK